MAPLVALAGQAIVGAVVSTLAGMAISRFTAKSPDAARTAEPRADRDRSPSDTVRAVDPLDVSAAPGGPCIGIFGRRRVGGRILFSATDAANRTHVVIALANARLTAIDGIFIDGVPASLDASGYVTSSPWNNQAIRVRLYRGNQTARDAIVALGFPAWSVQHVGRETAYAAITLYPVTPSPFANGVPDFTFAVRGFACYDPRITTHNINVPSTWTFSDNPAIVSANYLLHVLGAGDDVRPDDIDWESVRVAARICDEQVELKTGDVFEDRYACSVTWLTDEPHESVLDRIGQAMGGGTFAVGGAWRVTAAAYKDPTATFTTDTIIGAGLRWSETPPLAERRNGVRGTFSSPAHGYETRDFPHYQDAAALAADGGRESWLDLDLTTVNSHTQAQRLARIALKKARDGFRAAVRTKFEQFDTVADDVIAITDPLAGFNATTFRVLEESQDGFDLEFSLQRELSTFYAWTAATDEKPFIAERPIDDAGGGASTGSGWTANFSSTPLLDAGGGIYGTPSGGGAFLRINFAEVPVPGYRHEYQYDQNNSAFSATAFTGSEVLTSPAGAADLTLATVTAANLATFRYRVRHRTVQISTGLATPWRYLVGSSAISGFVNITTIDDFTAANTPYYKLPAAGYPSITNGTGGAIRLTVPFVDSTRATTVELMVSATNDPSTATVHAGAGNAVGGTLFTYPRVAGQTRYFWARAANGGIKGPLSNVVAVTFT